MKWITRTAAGTVAVAAATAGGVVAGRAVAARRYGRIPGSLRHAKLPEWLVTTVNAAPTGVVGPDGALPEPLARLGESVEVQIHPAPGDKGTELRVRPRPPGHGKSGPDEWRELRVALRETKQVLETGEVLQPDRPSTTRDTVRSRPLAYATRHAREEGRL